MIDYRKIYEQNYGPIPKDENGRCYDIHHIDGNRSNNKPDNLKAVSIQDHYYIHFIQEDWNACLLIASKMELHHNELSELARKSAHNRVKNGTHPFQTRPDGTNLQTDRVAAGNHNFLDSELQRKTAQKRVANGTHPLQTRPDGTSFQSDKVASGIHHFQTNNPCNIIVKCPYCPKEGPKPQMKQHHFDNCKNKPVGEQS